MEMKMCAKFKLDAQCNSMDDVSGQMLDGRMTYMAEGSDFHVKKINLLISDTDYATDYFKLMSKIHHRNCLRTEYITSAFKDGLSFIVFQWSQGNLEKYLTDEGTNCHEQVLYRGKSYSQPSVQGRELIKGIISGLIYLHKSGLVHGGLTKESTRVVEVDGNPVILLNEIDVFSQEIKKRKKELEKDWERAADIIECFNEKQTNGVIYEMAEFIDNLKNPLIEKNELFFHHHPYTMISSTLTKYIVVYFERMNSFPKLRSTLNSLVTVDSIDNELVSMEYDSWTGKIHKKISRDLDMKSYRYNDSASELSRLWRASICHFDKFTNDTKVALHIRNVHDIHMYFRTEFPRLLTYMHRASIQESVTILEGETLE
ncbi:hypothetical protein QJS10_CPB17g02399 [Acorus calamus]|uniref:KEN domain-containing protein n=1 Tax=Acorus calamus TaxID=4465 RepID=A0AAV9CX28_ACOCL|nr:hypothetical protein QJS10_CPB17g02399 [Acorus calamus]